MKIAVTGAHGFVGRTLMPTLANTGWEPVGVGRRDVGPIGPTSDWGPVLRGAEIVVHLAAMVHVMHKPTSEESAAFFAVNTQGTEKLARDAVKAGVRRLVFLSSAKVMGDQDPGRPFAEGDAPDPGDAYANSKLRAEEGLRRVGSEMGLEIAILRPPLVYGPEVKGNFLRLLGLCAHRWPLPFKSVRNGRSLISVRNLSHAIAQCVEVESAAGITAFVSDGVDLSTPELIAALRGGMNRPAGLVPMPPGVLSGSLRAMGRGELSTRLLSSFRLDDTLIRRSLAWSPPQPPEEGLAEVARWFIDRR